MNALLHWLASSEWALIVKALLHSLWQGALIVGVLVLVLRRVASPAARHRLALSGLAVLLLATVVTWGVLNAPRVPTPAMVPAPVTEVVVPPAATGPVDRIVVAADWTPARPQTQWTAWLALAWLVGAGVMLGRASVKIAGAEQLRRSCQPINDPHIIGLVAEARRAVQLTRQIRVAVTNQLTSPAVVGVIVPTLILPLSLITTLSHEQLRFILLHELAHIRRGDYLANLFQLFAEALLFFNPAVWWLSHQVRREREACCDALAIELSGAPADYARTLVSVAERMLQPVPAPAFGDEREPSALCDRVHRALVPGYQPSLRLTWRAMLGALLAGGAMLGLLAAGTRESFAVASALLATPDGTSEQASNESAIEVKFDTNLITRAFKISSLELARVMGDAGPLSTTNAAVNLQRFLEQAGFDRSLPGRTFFFSDAGGLLVRGTQEEVSGVEKILTQNLPALPGDAFTRTADTASPATEAQSFDVPAMSLSPGSGAARGYKFGVLTLTIHEDGHYFFYHNADLDLEGLRSRLVEWTNAIQNEQFLVLAHTNAPAQSISNALALITEFGSTAKIEPLVPPDMSTVWEPLTEAGDHEAGRHRQSPAAMSGAAQPGRAAESGDTNLLTRSFRVDLNLLGQGMDSSGQPTHTNLQVRLRVFFKSLGVDLQPPKSLFLNDRTGAMLVRATPADLDTIEQALQVANTSPPQVNIRARFVEIPADKSGILLGSIGLPSSNLVASPSPGAQVTAISNCFTGILTEPQAAAAFRALEARDGVEVVSAPEVTTLSGRQAQIQIVDIRTIVTGVASTGTRSNPTNTFQTSPLPFGPTLDVVPFVGADGHSIQMALIPNVTEFLGYEKPSAELTRFARENALDPNIPLPIFRVRQAVATATVWDGQTIVMGGLVAEQKTMTRKKTPVLGDLPFLSPLFRSESAKLEKKNLFIFITPTLIDPAGNRLHPDDSHPVSQPAVFPGQAPGR